jgi:hypothetical protein
MGKHARVLLLFQHASRSFNHSLNVLVQIRISVFNSPIRVFHWYGVSTEELV